ncbi:MAG: nuclear transport factor 2 family protein, partial [Streptosporangiaceae bacterium]
MTTTEMASALGEVQAKLAAAHLVAEYAHGIDGRDLDRAMATWHADGVSAIAPDTVLTGRDTIRDHLERTMAAYPEMYHWFTNLSVSVTAESSMRIECRIAALCRNLAGVTIREVGTGA